MRIGILVFLSLALSCLLSPSYAGEVIHRFFDDRFNTGAQPHADLVLANVPIKAVVAEFLDPADTGLGKSMGYLVWREVLTAIGDQAGAGVILARAASERRLTDLLETAYHDAAISIAREQRAGMAVWGAVNADSDTLYVNTYLSLLPSSVQLKLQLVGEQQLLPGLEADITRTNFNFPVVETTRAKLFERRVVTRVRAKVRSRADRSAFVLAIIPKGEALDTLDMEKGWFKVRLADGRFGYLDNSIVDVPPRTVEGVGMYATLTRDPGGQPLKRINLVGSYRVLDMRYVPGKGLWYELDIDDIRGWAPANLLRARFSLPIVHFLAGLYRYQVKRYSDARREFAQYVSESSSSEDNPSLATAYQLLGASTLLQKHAPDDKNIPAVELFSRAVIATPYDPNAYSLRALSVLAERREATLALADLERALELDYSDFTAARIIRVMYEQVTMQQRSTLKYLLHDSGQPAVQLKIKELVERYPVQQKDETLGSVSRARRELELFFNREQ